MSANTESVPDKARLREEVADWVPCPPIVATAGCAAINKGVDNLRHLAAKAQRLGEAVEQADAEHYQR